MAAVPADLREFRLDDWLPFLDQDLDEPAGMAAVQRWLDARRQWVREHGYPDRDPIPWLKQNLATRDDVMRRAYSDHPRGG